MIFSATTTTGMRFFAEVKTRVMIGILIFLVWELSRLILKSGTGGVTQLLVYSLVDVLTIVIMPLLFNGKRVARDTNELNCYSLIFHLIYFPFYFNGIAPTIHNNAIDGLMVIFAIRLIYFGRPTSDGDYAGFPPFGPLGFFRQWQAKRHSTSLKLNNLPALLFFGSLAPLSFIAYRSNDMGIAFTVAGLSYFIYFIANKMNEQRSLITNQQATDQQATAQPAPMIEESTATTAPPNFAPRKNAYDPDAASAAAQQIIADYQKEHPNLDHNDIANSLGLQYFVKEDEEEEEEYPIPPTTTPNHYLDKFANPGAVLHGLLQFLPEHMVETGIFDANEARLSDAIGYQASQANKIITAGMAALQPLLPPTMESDLAMHTDLCRLMAYLHNEQESTGMLAYIYQDMVTKFYIEEPDMLIFDRLPALNLDYHQRQRQAEAKIILERFEKHFYFPLASLLRVLPADVLNAPRLTPRQAQMCTVVELYSGRAQSVLCEGITALSKLEILAQRYAPKEDYPDIGPFFAYLYAEVEFMNKVNNEYHAAAKRFPKTH